MAPVTCQSNGKAQRVHNGIAALLGNVAEGEQNVVGEHGSGVWLVDDKDYTFVWITKRMKTACNNMLHFVTNGCQLMIAFATFTQIKTLCSSTSTPFHTFTKTTSNK